MQLRDTYQLINRRRRRRARSERSFSRNTERLGLGLALTISLLLSVTLLVLGLFYTNLITGLPSLDQLPILLNAENGLLLQPTRLYDRQGSQLLYTIENPGVPRRYLPLDPRKSEYISPHLVQLTVALVEAGFWQSPGFSLHNLTSSQPLTLAERLVSDLLLWQEPTGLRRAFYLRLLAAQLIARNGRSQVLEWYLNSAYYGHRAYGADSAAQLYLGKPASQLDLAESALLVAVAETPALNPIDSPVAARERQREVLDDLLEMGAINQQEHDQASQVEMRFMPAPQQPIPAASAFTHLVLDQLAKQFDTRRVEMGGLRIITTLDLDLQAQVQCAVVTQLLRLENQPTDAWLSTNRSCDAARLLPTMPPSSEILPATLSASAAILDPASGQLLALLGNSTLTSEAPVLTSHDPGSLLTPFISMVAFSRGFNPASLVWDVPATLPDDLTGQVNPDGNYHGPVRLRIAVANDYLLPLAHLLEQLGSDEVWRLAAPLGLTGLSGSQKPSALIFGNAEMTLLEAAHSYSVFANNGLLRGARLEPDDSLQPVVIRSVQEIDGRSWMDETPSETQAVLNEQLAYLVHNVLADDVARHPSLGYPNPLSLGRPSAAKVGQIAAGTQVWTVGYTKARLTAVWMGVPVQGDQPQLDVKMAAGIWHALMQYANRDLPQEDWSAPPGINTVSVCDPSGGLPTQACPSTVDEVFLAGSEPLMSDTLYRVLQVNRETGLLATVFTPAELVEERTYMIVPSEAQTWAESAGLSLPPTSYDVIDPPPPSAAAHIDSPEIFSYVRGKLILHGTASGNDFVSYRLQIGQGLNPQTWQQLGEEQTRAVTDGTLGAWDTQQNSDGLYALRLIVQRSSQHIETAVSQVTVDNTPPQVNITFPVTGQTLTSGEVVSLQCAVAESIGVARLAWYIDAKLSGETSQAPFSLPWSALSGNHILEVEAADLAGNTSRSESVPFTVK